MRRHCARPSNKGCNGDRQHSTAIGGRLIRTEWYQERPLSSSISHRRFELMTTDHCQAGEREHPIGTCQPRVHMLRALSERELDRDKSNRHGFNKGKRGRLPK
jgi:hypothetical protein